MIKELFLKNRSYRRFYQNEDISMELLEEMIDNARIANSAANKQGLKYIISNNSDTNEDIFKTLSWAAYLKDWDGPISGERPAAYLVILGDTEISSSYDCDVGIAIAYILLTAVESGFGGCIFASIERKILKKKLNIDERFEVLYVIAIGKPRESVLIEKVKANGDIKYYRDEENIHHVPKRSLDELIIKKIADTM